jgi:Outer membrane protein beta-barrel domain
MLNFCKNIILIFCFLFFIHLNANAFENKKQNDSLFIPHKHVLKVRVLYPFYDLIFLNQATSKMIGFSYERIISKKRTFNLSLDIERKYLLTNNGAGLSQSNGVSIYPEYRFYLFNKSNSSPKGFFLAPSLALGMYSGWNIQYLITNQTTLVYHSNFKVITMGAGMALGCQYFLGKNKRLTMNHSLGVYANKNYTLYEDPISSEAFRMYPLKQISYTAYIASCLGYTFGKTWATVPSIKTREESSWSIGVHAAPSISIWTNDRNYRNKYHIQYQPKIVFMGGIALAYRTSPKFAIGIELNYERKGSFVYYPSSFDANGNVSSTIKSNASFNYITLPIMAKFKMNKERFSLFANAGVYTGYLIKYNSKFNSTKIEGDFKHINRWDMGLVTGLGMEIPMNKQLLFSTEIRNNLAVNTIYDNADSYAINTFSRNESLNVIVGMVYLF